MRLFFASRNDNTPSRQAVLIEPGSLARRLRHGGLDATESDASVESTARELVGLLPHFRETETQALARTIAQSKSCLNPQGPQVGAKAIDASGR